jgi:hypothetical protein
MTSEAPPNGWGADALTSYLQDFRRNQFATFANKGQATKDLVTIDELYGRLMVGAVNPRPFYPLNFMLRAHAAYRAGVSAIMGGQVYEAQSLLRLCLEHAAYGFYVGSDKERLERWLRRGDSDANRKAVRKEFHNDRIRAHISARAPVLGDHFNVLYDRLMDFGAHPNEQGYSLNSTIIRDDSHVHFNAIYLHGDGLPLDLGMRTAAQVGLWPLHLMQLLYRERYELLGIRGELDELRKRF